MIIDNFRCLLHPKGYYFWVGEFLLICLLFNFSNFVFCELPAKDAESATQKIEQAIIKGELEDFNKAIEKLIVIVKLPGSGGEHAVYVRFLRIIELLRNLKEDRYCFLRTLKKLGCELEKKNVKFPVELKKLEEITYPSEFVNLPSNPDKSSDTLVMDSVVPLQIDNLPRPLEDTSITSNKHILNWITLKKASYFLISAILLALGIGNKRLIDYLRKDAVRCVQEIVKQAQLEKWAIEGQMRQLEETTEKYLQEAATEMQQQSELVQEATKQAQLAIMERKIMEREKQSICEEYERFLEEKKMIEELLSNEVEREFNRTQKAEDAKQKVEEELRQIKEQKEVIVV